MATKRRTNPLQLLVSLTLLVKANAGGTVKIVPLSAPQDVSPSDFKGKRSPVDLSGLQLNLVPDFIEAKFVAGGAADTFAYVPRSGADSGIEADGWHGKSKSGSAMNVVYNARTGITSG